MARLDRAIGINTTERAMVRSAGPRRLRLGGDGNGFPLEFRLADSIEPTGVPRGRTIPKDAWLPLQGAAGCRPVNYPCVAVTNSSD